MHIRSAVLTLAMLVAAAPGHAQPKESEAARQSSTMGPASGNTGGANNGIGTTGSLSGNAGSASSTVAGTGIKTDGGNKGAGGTLENDPALGGGQQQK